MDWNIIYSFGASAVIVGFLLPLYIHWAPRLGLLEQRDLRKLHRPGIVGMGGWTLWAALVVVLLICYRDGQPLQTVVILTLVTGVGMLDDLLGMAPLLKLGFQILIAVIAVYGLGYFPSVWVDLVGISKHWQFVGGIIAVLWIVAVINGFNLMDGLDGWMTSLAMIILVSLGVHFWWIGDNLMSHLLAGTCGALLVFYVFNREPAQVFLGDSGALLVGMIAALTSLGLVEQRSEIIGSWSSMLQVLGFLWLPLLDMMRVFVLRIMDGASPFRADRRHVHHVLQNYGWTAQRVCLQVGSAYCLWCMVVWLSPKNNPWILTVLLFIISMSYLYVLYRLSNKSQY